MGPDFRTDVFLEATSHASKPHDTDDVNNEVDLMALTLNEKRVMLPK